MTFHDRTQVKPFNISGEDLNRSEGVDAVVLQNAAAS